MLVDVKVPVLAESVAEATLLTWHKQVNGFICIGMDRRKRTITFRCTHWDPETKLCDSYDSRPGMCRDYPRNLLDFARPAFLPECSYYAIDGNAEHFAAVLDDTGLAPEQLDEVKRKLYLTPPARVCERPDTTRSA